MCPGLPTDQPKGLDFPKQSALALTPVLEEKLVK